MPKIVKNLTDKQIKSAITVHKNQEIKSLVKLSDGKGLFFVIDKKGCAFWRFDYVRPVSSKRNSISFGTYPEVMCAEKTGGFNLVNYRHSSGVYHEQETEDLHRRF